MKRRFLTAVFCVVMVLTCVLSFASCGAASGGNGFAEDYEPAPPVKDDSYLDVDLGSGLEGEGESEYERKIIKTANISAQATDFDEAVKMIEQLCINLDGYIESSSVSGKSLTSKGTFRHASYTLRIPAASFDGFCDGIGGIVNVTSSSSSSDEVTSTYYDIKSRIEVLEMQKESLQKLYDEYTEYGNINYLIELQDKLYEVISEIEAYETQIRLYDSKVAYSTIHLNISEVEEYTEEEKETFGQAILGALKGGWDFFLTICQGLLIAFVACLPFTIFFGIVAAVIVFICVSSAKRRRRRQQGEDKQQ